jgi:hypothetical protein
MTKDTESTLKVIRCFCSEETLKSRLMRRGEARDEWKIENWADFIEREPVLFNVPFPHLDIDTEKPLADSAKSAISYIVS